MKPSFIRTQLDFENEFEDGFIGKWKSIHRVSQEAKRWAAINLPGWEAATINRTKETTNADV